MAKKKIVVKPKPKLAPVPQGCIYLLRNLVNGKGYVGQYLGIVAERRWARHIRTAFWGSEQLLCKAIRKYGPENFSAEVIWRGNADLLDEKETHYIKKHHTFIDDPKGGGYNLTRGGRSGTRGWKPTDKTKKNISDGVKAAYKRDPTLAVRIGKANSGRSPSAETRALISESGKGRPSWNKGLKTGVPSWNKGKSSWAKGMKFTPEHCAKISATRIKLNIVPDQKTREKISATLMGNIPWNKGKKMPPGWSAEHHSHLLGRAPWNKGKKTNLPPWNKDSKLVDRKKT